MKTVPRDHLNCEEVMRYCMIISWGVEKLLPWFHVLLYHILLSSTGLLLLNFDVVLLFSYVIRWMRKLYLFYCYVVAVSLSVRPCQLCEFQHLPCMSDFLEQGVTPISCSSWNEFLALLYIHAGCIEVGRSNSNSKIKESQLHRRHAVGCYLNIATDWLFLLKDDLIEKAPEGIDLSGLMASSSLSMRRAHDRMINPALKMRVEAPWGNKEEKPAWSKT